MMALDPRKLVYFAMAVECGTLKKAAAVLGLTQPALSHSLARLEADIGHRLLDRGPTGVETTQLGDRIYAHARQIRDELQLIEKLLAGESGDHIPGLHFGALPSLSVSVIPEAIMQWRARHPLENLNVVQKVQVELLDSLLAHEIDFFIGVTDSYDHLSGLRRRVLFRETLHVIGGAAHPLAGKKDVSWQELAAYPWVTPSAGRHAPLLETILRSHGIQPPATQTHSSSISMLKSLILSGDNLALLPLHAVAEEIGEGKMSDVPIRSPLLSRNVAVFTRDGHDLGSEQADLIESVRLVGSGIAQRTRSPD